MASARCAPPGISSRAPPARRSRGGQRQPLVTRGSAADDLARLLAENARLRKAAGLPPAPPPPVVTRRVAPAPPPRPAPQAAPPRPAALAPVAWPTPGEEFWLRPPRLVAVEAPAEWRVDASPLHVVHISAEMTPFAKVGGLGDVVTGLARECLARGHCVEVILPFYSAVEQSSLANLAHELDLEVPTGRAGNGALHFSSRTTAVFRAEVAGVPVALVRPAGDMGVFRGVYGTQGGTPELPSALYFCRAALEYLHCTGRQPDILHLHEWQASVAAMLFWETYSTRGLFKPRLVLTIHNIASTGECRADEFAATGCDGAPFMTPDRALDERTIGHNPERLCLLKGGIVYANAVTTVSRTYAQETLGGGGGFVTPTLAQKAAAGRFSGITNGIDTDEWNPATDPYIPAGYSGAAPPASLAGKAACKRFVQLGLGLDEAAATPLLVVVSRLVPQKGIGLMLHACARAEALGYQLVILGTGGAARDFQHFADRNSASSRLKVLLMYNDALAHSLFAAADMVLVPSAFEPCGLTQLVAQRYGAPPVVRKTGGLADTVADGATGFVFDGPPGDAAGFEGTLARALALYRQPAEWGALVARCMAADVSWRRPAEEYLALYRSVAAA